MFASLTSIAFAPCGDIWLQLDDGRRSGTYSFGDAPVYTPVRTRGTIVARPGGGYWVIDARGCVSERGLAPALEPVGSGIVAATATPSGEGLWALDRAGAVRTAGDAGPFGAVTGHPSAPAGIAATPSGAGYYIALVDGLVYALGDAEPIRSAGALPWHARITGLALHRDEAGDVDGYWLLGADGTVHGRGEAPSRCSRGYPATATGLAATPDGAGYAFVLANGWISTAAVRSRSVILR